MNLLVQKLLIHLKRLVQILDGLRRRTAGERQLVVGVPRLLLDHSVTSVAVLHHAEGLCMLASLVSG